MWIDLFVSAPVTLFLVWLYRYSTPSTRPGWLRVLDAAVLMSAPLALVAIIAGGHAWIDYPGTGLNVMLVAAAYVVVLALLGLGWALRFARGRR